MIIGKVQLILRKTRLPLELLIMEPNMRNDMQPRIVRMEIFFV